MASLLLSVEEAAAELRIGRSGMFELLRDGVVTSIRIGGRRLVLRESLEAYVRRLAAEQAPGAGGAEPVSA